jgi:hypothetical protein
MLAYPSSRLWTGGWVGSGVGLDVVTKREILLYLEPNPGLPARSLVTVLTQLSCVSITIVEIQLKPAIFFLRSVQFIMGLGPVRCYGSFPHIGAGESDCSLPAFPHTA